MLTTGWWFCNERQGRALPFLTVLTTTAAAVVNIIENVVVTAVIPPD